LTAPAQTQATTRSWDRSIYREWIATQDIPIHEGYFIGDLRTVELGWWESRGCSAAILLLAGQEGVSEARVSEVPAGGTTRPVRMGLDEVVYVVEGRGITSIWTDDQAVWSFEWQKQSLFRIPANYQHQYANTMGDRPARLHT
jgi:mannose-6-phosphate isomerase-like protein (cupin superfamily)